MGGLNSSNTAETAVYSAQSLVKGDSQWKLIAANGWQDNWPVYTQTGITMNSKIYFFGMIILIMLHVTLVCGTSCLNVG